MTKPRTILIVGLGLMGGSLAAACRKKFPQTKISAVSRNPKAIQQALRKKWIHTGFRDLKSALKNIDLVVLCTPVDTFTNLLKQIENLSEKPVLVTDVGSVKGEIVPLAEGRAFKKVQFVGAHPMVGSHERGMEAASLTLYDHGFTFVTRTRKTHPAAFQTVRAFWQRISPKVIALSPEKHDAITAQISHLPHAVAVCLMLSAEKNSLGFAGPGFWDTTRIAAGHPSIWRPIFQMNKKGLSQAMLKFEKNWFRFKSAVLSSEGDLQKVLEDASRRRLSGPKRV